MAAKKAAGDKKSTESKSAAKESESGEKPTTSVAPTETKKKSESRKSAPATPATPKNDEQVKKSKRISEKLSATKIKLPSAQKTKKADEKRKTMPATLPSESLPSTSASADPILKEIKKEIVDTPIINFLPGTPIEAQTFDSKWMSARVVEVDMEDREVLVRFLDKSNKSKSG